MIKASSPRMQDSELIAKALAGCLDSFGKLIERYQRSLYYFVVGKVAAPEEAQDIVQKSFVSACKSLRQFKQDADFFAWLKGIALNHCRNEWRRQHTQATIKNRLLEARRAELELLRLDNGEQLEDARLPACAAACSSSPKRSRRWSAGALCRNLRLRKSARSLIEGARQFD